MDDGNGSGDFIRITNRMVWDKLAEIENRLEGMDRRQDAILAGERALREKVDSIDARTDKLQTRFNGVLTGIGAGLAVGLIAFLRGFTGG